jgi:5-methylcytosine-specific restriction protein A
MFPEYEALEEPLLCFIYLRGGTAGQVRSSDTYRPLADAFGLTTAERAQARSDGRDEPHWNNMVQWARRKLKDRGYLQRSPHGTWRLSDEGVVAARKRADSYKQYGW